jgi:tRNA(Ile)-lysidine synthetase-like protein
MNALAQAIAAVPPGNWAVAVSGGADSVALLRLLCERADLALHIVHLDHQTRGQASADDAAFVKELSENLGVPCTVALRSDIEPELPHLPENRSARYRMVRLELYRRVVCSEQLQGVLLAHHADDQAETVLQRLIRGSAVAGLCGMSQQTRIGSLLILRPLLDIDRPQLRNYLGQIGQAWRDDASNQSDQYLRNRLRRRLAADPELRTALLELCSSCRALRAWTRKNAPMLAESFRPRELQGLPPILARESARQWLLARGGPPGALTEATLERLVEMACDAASSPRQTFPGDIVVRRAGGKISHWKSTAPHG